MENLAYISTSAFMSLADAPTKKTHHCFVYHCHRANMSSVQRSMVLLSRTICNAVSQFTGSYFETMVIINKSGTLKSIF